MFNFDKNNGFFSDIPIQSRDLITAMNNNTQLGKQLLGKLDQMIKNNSETNQEMKNATSQMKIQLLKWRYPTLPKKRFSLYWLN